LAIYYKNEARMELITRREQQVSATKVDAYQRKIRTAWQKTIDGILETASLIADANETLNTQEWNQLVQDLPFGDSVRSMMLGIGNTKRFNSQRIQKLLPPNYNILYEYSTLDNDEWKQAILEGIVDTDVSTKEVRRWKQDMRLGGSSTAPTTITGVSDKFFAVIPAIDDLKEKDKKQVKKLLDNLQTKLKPIGADLIYQETTTATYRQQQLDKQRETLKSKLTGKLQSHLKKYNKNVSFRELEQIESAYYQYRYYQDHERYAYANASKPRSHSIDDIRHPDNPFGEDEMGFRGFMKWVRNNNVITQWTPIRELKELGEAKCIKLGLEHTNASNHAQRSNYKRQLTNISKRGGVNSKYAKKYLDMLIDG
jgi:hypothetical protein